MNNQTKRALILLLALGILFGCVGRGAPPAPGNALRIGVTPDYPPMIFKQDGRIVGVEADLAYRLAEALQTPLQFVELDWRDQIPSLAEGKIDIIMTGMTITNLRKTLIDFSDPYLRSGLVTLMRVEDASNYRSARDIRESAGKVGVMQGTTGEAYVRQNFPYVQTVIAFMKPSDAAFAVKNMRIDLFIDKYPSIVWLASENEGTLKGFWEPLTEEYIGWGIRQNNQALLEKVNAVLRTWKKDGTLKAVLSKWIAFTPIFPD